MNDNQKSSLQERRYPVESGVRSREAFDRDRARIIHSSSFRKLQSKTQVLGIGEGDFYRTRLTHSQEVAQIGRGIVDNLMESYSKKDLIRDTLPSRDCIEAICLAHDLGHPPFGHGGEVALDFKMKDFGGFEGNGQTLRIISSLESHTPEYGLNLTRRTMLGVLKYPAEYEAVVCRYDPDLKSPCMGWKPPKCFLSTEKTLVEWLLHDFSEEDRINFQLHTNPEKPKVLKEYSIKLSHGTTKYKTLDCSIMEIADDIAYGVHDLEDAIALNLIQQDDLAPTEELMIRLTKNENILEHLFRKELGLRKIAIGQIVHVLITSVEITFQDIFEHPILELKAVLPADQRILLDQFQKLILEHMIKKPSVRSLEWRGQDQILKLFDVFVHFAEDLIPKHHLVQADDPSARYRSICDFIAGMSDEYAIRWYERLFIPRQRTMFDQI